MLSKDELRKEFARDPKSFYSTETFVHEGFERRQCKGCGKYFWTLDPGRDLCGDSAHEPYSFIRDKPREIEYVKFWDDFSRFFRENGHTEVESYPVVSRWRQDLYFVIAGIQDFQRIENGRMSFEYPANPLIVPQICMRFNDIPNIGVTGRHYTSFMMANQTSFNYPKAGYWRDRTIELNYKYLTAMLGVRKEDLTYVEDVWAMGDFSEYGPSLEFFANGLELGNNVFTQFEYSNGRVSELPGKVVDVGWGLDAREMWYYAGTQTAFDAVFRRELEYIHRACSFKPDHRLYSKIASMVGKVDLSEVAHGSEAERKLISGAGIGDSEYYDVIKPMQAAYAIADHTRTLLFAISDGALPSNTGGGYNLRIILRRVFDFMDRYNMGFDIMKLMEMHVGDLKRLYKNVGKDMGEIAEVIDIERKRHDATKSAALKTVTALVEKGEALTVEKMRTLYESNGITPDLVTSIASSKGVKLELSEEAYTKIIKGDFVEGRERHKEVNVKTDVAGLPRTEQLFYKFASESDSKVLKSEGDEVVLDRSPFYAESGGQEADFGTIGGHELKNVQTVNGVIVHVLEQPHGFKVGESVRCVVDLDRRTRLMAHHTATHLINASARRVLGDHAWQEGAHKGPHKAHIDIAHYERLSDEQVAEIEATANRFILGGIRVKMEEMDRNEAESKFGFTIYQGHGVPASRLRIVSVSDLSGKVIDAEACGGLHLQGRETSIGLIKIIASSRPHDGIDRLEFVAGPAAADYINSMEQNIRGIAALAGLDKDKVRQGLEIQLKELAGYRRQYKVLSEQLADHLVEQLSAQKAREIVKELDYDKKMLREVGTRFTQKHPESVILLHNKASEFVCIAGDGSGKSAVDFMKANAPKAVAGAFTGGGSKKIAEGRITPG